jgi:hypothetical protein
LIDIKDYVNKMTREEFINYTDEGELCPDNFNLSGFENTDSEKCSAGDNLETCHKCFNAALKDIKFKDE